MTIYNRVKENGGMNTSTVYPWSQNAGGSPVQGSSIVSYDSILYRKTEGMNTPNFHQRLKRGELLPFTHFRQKTLNGHMTAQTYDTQTSGYPTSGHRDWRAPKAPGFESWLSYSDADLDALLAQIEHQKFVDAAASKAYSKGRFDVLTFLAEFAQLVDMFKGLIKKFIDLIHGKPAGLPWDLWLEGRYGWRILIFDLLSFNEALANLEGNRSRVKERAGLTISGFDQDVSYGSSTDVDRTITIDTNWNLSVRGSVIADLDLSPFQFNPIVTGWELIKFSFVVDWFIGVGSALNSLSFLALNTGYTAAGGYLLNVTKESRWDLTAKPGYVINTYTRAATLSVEYVVRVPASVSTIPHLSFNLKDWKILDSLALLLQAIIRR